MSSFFAVKIGRDAGIVAATALYLGCCCCNLNRRRGKKKEKDAVSDMPAELVERVVRAAVAASSGISGTERRVYTDGGVRALEAGNVGVFVGVVEEAVRRGGEGVEW